MTQETLQSVVRYIHRIAETPRENLDDRQLLEKFALHGDGKAFASLVERHGSMVLGVCHRILGNRADAEDAFQATFLVLARKAGAVHWRETVGPWLATAAYRLAAKLRTETARQNFLNHRAFKQPTRDPGSEVALRELQVVIDEEVQRLPDKLQAPMVLCFLEGRTNEQAAKELGWSTTTVKGRLARARMLLRSRLTRRGVAPGLGLAFSVLEAQSVSAAIPLSLISSTAKLATLLAAGESLPTGLVSARVAFLISTALKAIPMAKMSLILAIVSSVAAIAGGAGLLLQQEVARTQDKISPPALPGSLAKFDDPNRTKTQADPVFIDRFGDPLPPEAVARLGTRRFRHGNLITSVTYVPDGKMLFAHGWDGIRLWDPSNGKELPRFPRDMTVSFAALSPDGKLVAAVESRAKGISLWDFSTGQLIRSFGEGKFSRIRFSPDGRLLLTFGSEPTTALWDVATGQQMHSWHGPVWAAIFTHDNKSVITGDDQVIRFLDVVTGKQTRELTEHPNSIGALTLSPDGSVLATIGQTKHKQPTGKGPFFYTPDNFVRLWDLGIGKEIRRLSGPSEDATPASPIPPIAFSPDGKMLVAGSMGGNDRFLRAWDPVTGQVLRKIALDSPCYASLAFCPDGKTIATCLGGTEIGLIDIERGKLVSQPAGHRTGVSRIVLSADARTVVTAGGESAIRVWDSTTGEERMRLRGHEGVILSLARGPDEHTIYSTGSDKTLRTWDLATGKQGHQVILDFAPKWPCLLAIAAGGKAMAMSGAENSVTVIDPATGKTLRTFPCDKRYVTGAAFSASGTQLAFWTDDGTVQRWDVNTGMKLAQFPEQLPRPASGAFRISTAATVSADGTILAYSKPDRTIVLQNLVTGEEIRRIEQLAMPTRTMALSPDGRLLAYCGSSDCSIRLVELATGKERRHLDAQNGIIIALAFSEDGRLLVSGNGDTTAMVWDLTGRFGAGDAQNKALTEKDLEACWKDLAAEDTGRANRAIWKLIATPAQAVSYLEKRVHAIPKADEQQVMHLIAEPDNNDFAIRQRATSVLDQLGETAMPAYLRILDQRPSIELRRKIEELRDNQVRLRVDPPPERLRGLRALEVLEHCRTREACRTLEVLAQGAAETQMTQHAKASRARLAMIGLGTP